MRKTIYNLCVFIFLSALLITLWIGKLVDKSELGRLQEEIVIGDEFRCQYLGEGLLEFLRNYDNPGEAVGIYLLESNFGYEKFPYKLSLANFQKLRQKWSNQHVWESYIEATKAIWNDVKYFPVPESSSDTELTVSYVDSWMYERTYGGNRGHEGTDIMADKNEPGLYPVISMTDGVITKKGWLEKGGYRIGVESSSGAYFYYAHLDSYANVNVGDEVKAGDILGYMGDSGYGPEGTTGKFDVHLHLGIYIYPEGEEMSINPYWVLRYIENKKVKCYTKE